MGSGRCGGGRWVVAVRASVPGRCSGSCCRRGAASLREGSCSLRTRRLCTPSTARRAGPCMPGSSRGKAGTCARVAGPRHSSRRRSCRRRRPRAGARRHRPGRSSSIRTRRGRCTPRTRRHTARRCRSDRRRSRRGTRPCTGQWRAAATATASCSSCSCCGRVVRGSKW